MFSFSHAHEGGHGGGVPGAIVNGKLMGADKVNYLDAGAFVTWNGQQLKRKISNSDQIIYQFQNDLANVAEASESSGSNFLELKVSGGELLKPFTFDHAGEEHSMIEMISPDFSRDISIESGKDLALRWKADKPADMVTVILEVYDSAGKLSGRVTASTTDDGEFDLPQNLINQLGEGEGKIANKRIWFGEFQPAENGDMIGVKCVVSLVGKLKIIAD